MSPQLGAGLLARAASLSAPQAQLQVGDALQQLDPVVPGVWVVDHRSSSSRRAVSSTLIHGSCERRKQTWGTKPSGASLDACAYHSGIRRRSWRLTSRWKAMKPSSVFLVAM